LNTLPNFGCFDFQISPTRRKKNEQNCSIQKLNRDTKFFPKSPNFGVQSQIEQDLKGPGEDLLEMSSSALPPTTIPWHDVISCKNIESRKEKLDVICKSKILVGENKNDNEVVLARLRGYKNGEKLANEYLHYQNGVACYTCFWEMLYDAMPINAKAVDPSSPLKGFFYFEIETKREDLEEDNCLRRFVKQQTERITNYCWSIEEMEESEGRNCLVRICVETESNKKPRIMILDRCFPDNSKINNKLDASVENISKILDDPQCVKQGDWDL
jgi:hypothetical protein